MSLTPAVVAINRLEISGDVTPKIWYQRILTPAGKPDFKAIVLLADLIYWYRPAEVRDELSGRFLGYRKRFRADKLQRSYDQFAKVTGMTKREVKEALGRLRDQGLITTEFRTVRAMGQKMSNVLYVEPVPSEIENITYANTEEMLESEVAEELNVELENSSTDVIANTFKCNSTIRPNVTGVTPKCNTSQRKIVRGGAPKRQTNTEITQENSQEISQEIVLDSGKPNTNRKQSKKTTTTVPDQFPVDNEMIDWLNTNGITTPYQTETEKFLDYHRSKGSRMSCWKSAWRNWMRNSMKFASSQRPATGFDRDAAQRSIDQFVSGQYRDPLAPANPPTGEVIEPNANDIDGEWWK